MNKIRRTEAWLLEESCLRREHRRLIDGSDNERRMRMCVAPEDVKQQLPEYPAICRKPRPGISLWKEVDNEHAKIHDREREKACPTESARGNTKNLRVSEGDKKLRPARADRLSK